MEDGRRNALRVPARPNVNGRPHEDEAEMYGDQDKPEPTLIPERPQGGDGRGGMIADRTPWLDLPKPWDNLEIRAWLDYPKSVADLWKIPPDETPDEADERVMMACQQIFLDHRAACQHADPQSCRQPHTPWRDAEGDLPEPNNAEFWERISTPLGSAILERFKEEMNASPTSRASRRKQRKNLRRR